MARKLPDETAPDEVRHAASTSHLLHRVQQLASDRFAILVGENGVTLRQYVVMTAIAETPDMTQVDLVRATGVDRSTLADMLNRLEQRGWVARKASEADARAKAVRLTDAGGETLIAARQHARAADAAILDALPRTKRKAFVAILEKLSAHADKLAKQAERDAKREAKKQAKQKAKARKKAPAKPALARQKQKRKTEGR